jgi:hypothetical protein
MSLILDGTNGLSDVDGSAATPAIRGSDANTGVFFGTDIVGVSTGGTERMRVNASGNVGIGTSSPGALLAVTKNQNAQTEISVTNSDTTNTSSRARVRALCGTVDTIVTSIAGDGSYVGASSNHALNLVTNGITRATIDSSGNLLVGATSNRASSTLDIRGDVMTLGSNASFFGTIDYSAGTGLLSVAAESGGGIVFKSGTTERMRIDTSGGLILAGSTAQKATGTTWSNPSDERLKDNIRDYTKGTAELMQVRVREWEYNGKGGTVAGTKGLGVVADEVMVVLPDTVENYEAKLNADDEGVTAIKKFDATEITWLLVKTVQELKGINDAQAQIITALTARVEALEGAQA